jgi:hypothetical protein
MGQTDRLKQFLKRGWVMGQLKGRQGIVNRVSHRKVRKDNHSIYKRGQSFNREKVMGELIDSYALQKQFFAILHEHVIHHNSEREGALDSASPVH